MVMIFRRWLQKCEPYPVRSGSDYGRVNRECFSMCTIVCPFEGYRKTSADDPTFLGNHVKTCDADVAYLVYL